MWSTWVTVASSTVILWTMVYVKSTGGDITSSWPNRDSLGQPATNQLVTRDNLNHDQSNQQDDSRVRLLMECHETVGSLKRDMEILQQSKDEEITSLSQTVEDQRNQILWLRGLVQEKENLESAAACGERGDRSDIMDALRELQDNMQEMKAENSNLRQTTTLLEEELASRSTVSDEAFQEVQGAVAEMKANEVEMVIKLNKTLASFEELKENFSRKSEEADSEGNESNDGRGMRQVLQEVQGAVEELKIKGVENNQTLASFEEQIGMLISKHEGAGCESGGVLYHNGEYLQDQCYPKKCNNGAMAVYLNHTTGNPCAPPFDPMTTGCYYYNSTSVTWCEARKQCWQMGGDLAMGPDFNTLEAYVTFKAGTSNLVWVGVRDDVWLTGQPPNSQEWSSGHPKSDQYECGRFNARKLADLPCVDTKHFVCQLF